jgi:ketosteroid isomerase-like protein
MRHTQLISFFTIATSVLLLLSCEPRNSDSETSASQNVELAEDYDEEFFKQLEREVFDAFELPGDAEAIDRLYSEDFLSINADASYSNKQDAVEMVEAARPPVVEEIINDETRVRQFGNTAVITGRSKYVSTEGDLGTVVVRHTMIWVKEDDRWQMVGWQGTALPGEEAYGPDLDDD